MYSLTLLWLTLVAAAFAAGRVSGRHAYQRRLRGTEWHRHRTQSYNELSVRRSDHGDRQ